jgi:cytochrome o ubiquinol oxidase subunit IV
MAAHNNPLAHPEVRQGSVLRYIAGTALSGAAMYFAYVEAQGQHPVVQLLEILGGALLFSLASQALLFFGLDASRAQIWKSISLILTVPLFLVMIGISVWAFASLYNRTMPDPAIMNSMSM